MEDSLYTKMGKAEADIVDLTQGISSLVEDGKKVDSAREMANQALESLQKLQARVDSKLASKDLLSEEMDKILSRVVTKEEMNEELNKSQARLAGKSLLSDELKKLKLSIETTMASKEELQTNQIKTLSGNLTTQLEAQQSEHESASGRQE